MGFRGSFLFWCMRWTQSFSLFGLFFYILSSKLLFYDWSIGVLGSGNWHIYEYFFLLFQI